MHHSRRPARPLPLSGEIDSIRFSRLRRYLSRITYELIAVALVTSASPAWASDRCEVQVDPAAAAQAVTVGNVFPDGHTLFSVQLQEHQGVADFYDKPRTPEFKKALGTLLYMLGHSYSRGDLEKDVDRDGELELGVLVGQGMSLQLQYRRDGTGSRGNDEPYRLQSVLLVTEGGRKVKLMDPALNDSGTRLKEEAAVWTGTTERVRGENRVNDVKPVTVAEVNAAIPKEGLPAQVATAARDQLRPRAGESMNIIEAVQALEPHLRKDDQEALRALQRLAEGKAVDVPFIIQGKLLEKFRAWVRWLDGQTPSGRTRFLRRAENTDPRWLQIRSTPERLGRGLVELVQKRMIRKMVDLVLIATVFNLLSPGQPQINMSDLRPSRLEAVASNYIRDLNTEEQTAFSKAVESLAPETISADLQRQLTVTMPNLQINSATDQANYEGLVRALTAAEQGKNGVVRNYVGSPDLKAIRTTEGSFSIVGARPLPDVEFLITEYDKTNVITLTYVSQATGATSLNAATVVIRKRDNQKLFDILNAQLQAARGRGGPSQLQQAVADGTATQGFAGEESPPDPEPEPADAEDGQGNSTTAPQPPPAAPERQAAPAPAAPIQRAAGG